LSDRFLLPFAAVRIAGKVFDSRLTARRMARLEAGDHPHARRT
jgi:hypothetical protein